MLGLAPLDILRILPQITAQRSAPLVLSGIVLPELAMQSAAYPTMEIPQSNCVSPYVP